MNLITIEQQNGNLSTEVKNFSNEEILSGILKMLCIINPEDHPKLIVYAGGANYSLIDIPTLALYDKHGKNTKYLEVTYSKLV